jgi:hypothetical protein
VQRAAFAGSEAGEQALVVHGARTDYDECLACQ